MLSLADVAAVTEVGLVTADYVYLLWIGLIFLGGLWAINQGYAHVGHEPKSCHEDSLLTGFGPLSLAIFFTCSSLVASLIARETANLIANSDTHNFLAQLGGQVCGIILFIGMSFAFRGSVQWSPSLEGQIQHLSPLEEIKRSWHALNKSDWFKAFLTICSIAIAASLAWRVFYFFSAHNGQTLPEEPQVLVDFIAKYDWHGPWLNAIILGLSCVVAAPVIEELVFRGTFYPALKRSLPRGYAIIITGTVFAIVHGSLAAFLPLTALGCMLCIFRDRFGLVTCMAIHAAFNFHTFVWLFLAPGASTKF